MRELEELGGRELGWPVRQVGAWVVVVDDPAVPTSASVWVRVVDAELVDCGLTVIPAEGKLSWDGRVAADVSIFVIMDYRQRNFKNGGCCYHGHGDCCNTEK